MLSKVMCVSLSALFLIVVSARSRPDESQKEAEKYILQSEVEWGETGINGDTAVVDRILADDFIGIDPDGNRYDKAKEMKDVKESAGEILSIGADHTTVRFFGDTAVAQGSDHWVRKSGTPLKGHYVWTDTWVKRNGKWQIVAAQDLLLANDH